MPSVRIDRKGSGPTFLEGDSVSYVHNFRHAKEFSRECSQRGINKNLVIAIVFVDGDHHLVNRGDTAYIMNDRGATLDTVR